VCVSFLAEGCLSGALGRVDSECYAERILSKKSHYDQNVNVFTMDKKDKVRKNQAGKSFGGTHRGRSGSLM
jgi:hypothetical protein